MLPSKRPSWNKRFIEIEKQRIVEWDERVRDTDREPKLVPDVKCCPVCKRSIEEHTKEQLAKCLAQENSDLGFW
mgnify:CR=1 FL=1